MLSRTEIALLLFLLGMVLWVLYACGTYSKDGDISLVTPNLAGIMKEYSTPQAQLLRLYQLGLYPAHRVRWPYYLAISLVAALLVLLLLNCWSATYYLIATIIIFLAIDLPRRWENAHVGTKHSLEVTSLYTQLKTYKKPIIFT